MGSRIKLPSAILLVSGILIGSATAQPSGQSSPQGTDSQVQPGGVAGNVYDRAGVKPGSDSTPAKLSEGTLAESAITTALATSTYHQPTGFLPGMRP